MSNFVIEYLQIADAAQCNSRANLPREKTAVEIESSPNDYDTELRKTWVCVWQSLIAYPIVWTYDFDTSDIRSLRELTKIGIHTGSLSKLYDDEVEQILIRLQQEWHKGEWFVRLDSLSPKDGVNYPVTDPRQLLEQLCISKRFQSALASDNRRLYFLRFDRQWKKPCEYRVFVCDGRLTTISQYSNEEQIPERMRIHHWRPVIDWLEVDVIQAALGVLETRHFSIDIYVDEQENVRRVIELNSFGYWLAASGCLFDWTKDRELLYGIKSPDRVLIRLIL